MYKRVYNEKVKKDAEFLMTNGNSYKEIKLKLGIPKSTLSTWFSRHPNKQFDKNAQINHLKKIRVLAKEAKRKKKDREQFILKEKIKKEILAFPLANIGLYKSMLAMLYWAEGSKYKGVSGTRFTNTDPQLMELFIELLRKCYPLTEDKFRVRIHIHYYHKVKAVKEFWSKLLNIPTNQFISIYVKKRGKRKRFRKNFMGICMVNYLDSNIRKELLELAYTIQKLTVNKNY